MKIGLIDVDGHNFPNLALMKLSAWHKLKGDTVELNSLGKYDRMYQSKVFTFTKDYEGLSFSPEIIKSGTGYKNYERLPEEIEHIQPDYSLYGVQEAYGYLTRGCIRKCPWCIVPEKEGQLRKHADITEFLAGRKSAILLDNNPLASDWGLTQIEKIIEMKVKIDFNQGLDARLIANNPDIAKLLAKVKWIRYIRMACDSLEMLESVEKAVKMIRQYSGRIGEFFVYVLVQDIESALIRVNALKLMNVSPFAQPYRDFDTNSVDEEARHFARWVNHKAVFKSVLWENYKPAAGFRTTGYI